MCVSQIAFVRFVISTNRVRIAEPTASTFGVSRDRHPLATQRSFIVVDLCIGPAANSPDERSSSAIAESSSKL